MTAEIFTTTEQGFAVTGLRQAGVELALVPALGGRVISLRNTRTGREWCWHQPRPDWLWRNGPADDFGRSPQAGMDECVPTVAACTWRGRAIPDHGEVWNRAWTLDAAELAAGRLSATVPLGVSPLVFERSIGAGGPGAFIFNYTLRNTGPVPEEYLWCAHPLLAIAAGDRLVLPPEVATLRLDGGVGDRPIQRGDTWAYPEPFPGCRLDRFETPGMPRGCVKGFAGPLCPGLAVAAIANEATGDRLEVRWDTQVNRYLGLWLNRGHVRFHHVALEPTNGAPDSLAEAVGSWKQFSLIPAGGTVRWSVEWHVA
ncbi:MAG: hypothetical protein PSU94_02955 [Lacunisphaera sp.]|nr:hypothetical protein [Lacunisphaera sp.]